LAVTDPAGQSKDQGPQPTFRRRGLLAGYPEPQELIARFLSGGLIGRSNHIVGLSAVLAIGFGLLIAGLEVVRASLDWGFTYSGALDGITSQLAVTGPAAVLMAVATLANVLAGAIVLRFLGAPAFRRLSDVALAGFAAAVVLDALAVFTLGNVGFFGWPELLALHAVVAVAYFATRRRRPLMAAPIHVRLRRPAVWWVLPLLVWLGPLIIQLASPTVPFQDVLPNHVAPVEHIRVFGSFATLTTSPSPLYGPSRLMLGYVALLGQLTTITNLDAVLAEAAFALPLTILMALALRRLAGELFGGSSSFWVLLTFPLTFTFMRIPDSRGTVVVFPLAAWALCTVAAELRARHKPHGEDIPAGRTTDRRSRRPDLALAFAIGGSFLVHPLVGLAAIAAVVGALILYPATLGRRLVPALASGLIIAIPQVLTMGAIEAQSWVGAVFIGTGVALAFGLAFIVGAAADRLSAAMAGATASDGAASTAGARLGWLPDLARAGLVATAIVAMLVIAAARIAAPNDPAAELMLDFPHLVWLSLAGVALSVLRFSRGWLVLGCGVAAGLAAWAASGLVGTSNLTEQAVHYEVPKSMEYWLPVMLAIGGAGALAALGRQRWLWVTRPAVVGVLLVVTVFPSMPLTTDVQIGEHRAAESLGLALREAERGYWDLLTYPDTRHIIDEPRQEVVDAIRAEEEAGRLGPATRVLHIAYDFQQWSSVPIGVFTGAMETSISVRPELSIHTVGGRLLGFDRLDRELASDYGYVVFEPAGLQPTFETVITEAGYHRIWFNSQAIIYARN
jgi:hypothetical protein